ncbi:MAG: hypothetical protein KAU01_02975, partial [Candidatus Cloacimonetes bacterium]|nr:hypothetical protein [Candidatus Cloacimonadota bacterium]
MKKALMPLVVMMILFTTAFASENWVGFTSHSAEVPQVTVVESDHSKLILDITIPGMKVYTIEEKGE